MGDPETFVYFYRSEPITVIFGSDSPTTTADEVDVRNKVLMWRTPPRFNRNRKAGAASAIPALRRADTRIQKSD
jgi:hypothetical protein